MRPLIGKELNSHFLADWRMEDNPQLAVMCRFTNSPPLYSLYMLEHSYHIATWKVLSRLQCILVPIMTSFLSLLPMSRLVSKCMRQNYVHKTRCCASTSHQTFSSTQLALKSTKCFLVTSFLHFSKFIFLCNPRSSTVILSLWLLLTQ